MTSQDSVFRVFARWVISAEQTHMGFTGLLRQAENEIGTLDEAQLNALEEALGDLGWIVRYQARGYSDEPDPQSGLDN